MSDNNSTDVKQVEQRADETFRLSENSLVSLIFKISQINIELKETQEWLVDP